MELKKIIMIFFPYALPGELAAWSQRQISKDSWLERKVKSLLGLLRFEYVNPRANMIV